MEKTITLIGVDHSDEYFPRTKELLEKILKPGQTIGLEVSPNEIKIMEKLFEPKSFFENTFLKKILHKNRIEENFFYKLFVLAKEKNIKIIPLDSNKKVKGIKTKFTNNDEFIKELYITGPLRDQWLAKKTLQTEPNIIIVGANHVAAIKKHLKLNNIKTKIYYNSPITKRTIPMTITKTMRVISKLRKKYRQKIRQNHNILNPAPKQKMMNKLEYTDLFIKIPNRKAYVPRGK